MSFWVFWSVMALVAMCHFIYIEYADLKKYKIEWFLFFFALIFVSIFWPYYLFVQILKMLTWLHE